MTSGLSFCPNARTNYDRLCVVYCSAYIHGLCKPRYPVPAIQLEVVYSPYMVTIWDCDLAWCYTYEHILEQEDEDWWEQEQDEAEARWLANYGSLYW